MFTSPPILNHRDYSLHLIVEVDASPPESAHSWRVESLPGMSTLLWFGPTTKNITTSTLHVDTNQTYWSLFLERFLFTQSYRPGSWNIEPDLSYQSEGISRTHCSSILPFCYCAMEDWRCSTSGAADSTWCWFWSSKPSLSPSFKSRNGYNTFTKVNLFIPLLHNRWMW